MGEEGHRSWNDCCYFLQLASTKFTSPLALSHSNPNLTSIPSLATAKVLPAMYSSELSSSTQFLLPLYSLVDQAMRLTMCRMNGDLDSWYHQLIVYTATTREPRFGSKKVENLDSGGQLRGEIEGLRKEVRGLRKRAATPQNLEAILVKWDKQLAGEPRNSRQSWC